MKLRSRGVGCVRSRMAARSSALTLASMPGCSEAAAGWGSSAGDRGAAAIVRRCRRPDHRAWPTPSRLSHISAPRPCLSRSSSQVESVHKVIPCTCLPAHRQSPRFRNMGKKNGGKFRFPEIGRQTTTFSMPPQFGAASSSSQLVAGRKPRLVTVNHPGAAGVHEVQQVGVHRIGRRIPQALVRSRRTGRARCRRCGGRRRAGGR